jgi:hypothetical protein
LISAFARDVMRLPHHLDNNWIDSKWRDNEEKDMGGKTHGE